MSIWRTVPTPPQGTADAVHRREIRRLRLERETFLASAAKAEAQRAAAQAEIARLQLAAIPTMPAPVMTDPALAPSARTAGIEWAQYLDDDVRAGRGRTLTPSQVLDLHTTLLRLTGGATR